MDEPGKENTTLIGTILFIACGIMVFSVIAVLVKRQIMRNHDKSKTEPHVSIGYDVPKKMKSEARRRLDRTVEIGHEPCLLNKEAKKYTSAEFEAVPHLYRMKALEHCNALETQLIKDTGQCRQAAEEFDMFFRNQVHLLSVQIPQPCLDLFYTLYRHARHEPEPFGKDCYNRMVKAVTDITNTIQGAKKHSIHTPDIRPIADIDEIADEQLPTAVQTSSTQFAFPIRQTVMVLAGKVFKKSKSKQDYQSVPSTESMDDINEATPL